VPDIRDEEVLRMDIIVGPSQGYRGEEKTFSGETFSQEKDGARLSSQLKRVRDLMLDGQWRTLREIQLACGGSEAGTSARLRDLRKPRFGGFCVERRRAEGENSGLWEYRLVAPIGQMSLI
jgi:hypothetical protein